MRGLVTVDHALPVNVRYSSGGAMVTDFKERCSSSQAKNRNELEKDDFSLTSQFFHTLLHLLSSVSVCLILNNFL